MSELQRVGIVGCGLIGGSLALRLQDKGIHVRVWDADSGILDIATSRGLFAASSIEQASKNADLVVIATPPDTITEIALQLLDSIGEQAVVTDVASVKLPVASLADKYSQCHRFFVSSHPMAGKATKGLPNADVHLFDGCTWVVCGGDMAGSSLVEILANVVGARAVVERTPRCHDRHVAVVSHIPQLLTTAVAASLSADDLADVRNEPVLREALRLARSPFEMWSQIVVSNAELIDEALSEMRVRPARKLTISTPKSLICAMSNALADLADQRDQLDPGTLELAGPGFRSATGARDLVSADGVSSERLNVTIARLRAAVRDLDQLAVLFQAANDAADSISAAG